MLALIVASLGIFGLLAFQVSRRINELGVRMALGASRGNLIGLVLREVGVMLVPGCAAGCIVALGLTRFAKSMLFGVTPTDPASFELAPPRWRPRRSRRDSCLRYERRASIR